MICACMTWLSHDLWCTSHLKSEKSVKICCGTCVKISDEHVHKRHWLAHVIYDSAFQNVGATLCCVCCCLLNYWR